MVIAGVHLEATGFAPNIAQDREIRDGLKAIMSARPLATTLATSTFLVLVDKPDEFLRAEVRPGPERRRKRQEAPALVPATDHQSDPIRAA